MGGTILAMANPPRRKKPRAGKTARRPKGPARTKPKEAGPDAASSATPTPTWLKPGYGLGVLIVLIVLCYFPLVRYFFAQDDFMLIYMSTRQLGEELAKTFGAAPYHFRPLTEFLYFAGAYKLFGLNPMPYHIISLLIHLANTVLVYLVLRNLRIGSASALVSSALFGMSVAWLHVVGWITCIQQLAPQLFVLLSIWFALQALRDGSRSKWTLSAVAYLATLFSYEQQMLAPVLIWLIAVLGLSGSVKRANRRLSITQGIKALWLHFAILAIYSAIRVFYKGMPEEGRAKFLYESNVFDNLVQYLGAMLEFWPMVTGLISWEAFDYRLSHILFAGLIAYHLQARRWREVVFAMSFILTMILPVLFMERHYYYYHTYAASLGAIYLIALALQDGFRVLTRLRIDNTQRRLTIAVALMILIGALSFSRIRANERRLVTETHPNRVSFVLHRATMAKRAYDDLLLKAGDMQDVRKVHFHLGKPGLVTTKGFTPFIWAMAQGLAVNLFFDNYGFKVTMNATRDIRPDTYETDGRRLFFYDTLGNIYTSEELVQYIDTLDNP